MIYLKKNDKLIIVIALAVIIIAAIGLAVYTPPDDDTNIVNNNMKMYDITWPTHTKTVNLDGELYAGRNSPFSEEVTIGDCNIIKVTIEISWEDDSTYGILTTKGADALTAEVTYKGVTDTWDSVYNGTREFTYTINSLPYDTNVEAESESEALDKINDEYSTDDSLTFIIDVSVQPGERLIRPLKYLRDGGNDFMLKITYEYYHPSLTEGDIKETGQDIQNGFDFNEEDDDEPAYLGILVNAGLTRW